MVQINWFNNYYVNFRRQPYDPQQKDHYLNHVLVNCYNILSFIIHSTFCIIQLFRLDGSSKPDGLMAFSSLMVLTVLFCSMNVAYDDQGTINNIIDSFGRYWQCLKDLPVYIEEKS